MAVCLKHQQTYGDWSQCSQCSLLFDIVGTPRQIVTTTETTTGFELTIKNKFYRIDHIHRHLNVIKKEMGKIFPSKRVIQREMLQIVIRLTDQMEDLIKGENK